MPREIVVEDWCDPCFEAGDREEGTTHIITIGNRKPRELLLCAKHEAELLEPLLVVLAKAPVAEGASGGSGGGKKSRKVTAAIAPAEPKATRDPADVQTPAGLPEPVIDEDGHKTWHCPDCEDVSYSTRDKKRPTQSLRLHLRQQHGWDV